MSTFRAAAIGNNNLAATAASVSITIPGTAQVGDLAITCVSQNSGTVTYTPPTGWTSISGPDNNPNTNLRTQLFAKFLTSGQPGTPAVFSTSSGGRLIGAMSVWSGVLNPLVTLKTFTTTGTASTSHTVPSVTTDRAGTAFLAFACVRTAAVGPGTTLSTPPSYTSDATVVTNFGDSPNYAMKTMHMTIGSTLPASYGGGTVTSGASGIDNMYLIGLHPATSTGTGMRMFIVRNGAEVPITLDLA